MAGEATTDDFCSHGASYNVWREVPAVGAERPHVLRGVRPGVLGAAGYEGCEPRLRA